MQKQKPETEIIQPFKKLIVIDISKENTIKSEFVREEKEWSSCLASKLCLVFVARLLPPPLRAPPPPPALPPRDCDAHQQSVYTIEQGAAAAAPIECSLK